MRSLALLRGRGSVWSAWGRLLDVVRTGKTAPELVAGKRLYEWLADDPAGLNVFNQAMTELSIAQAQVVADAFDSFRMPTSSWMSVGATVRSSWRYS